MRISALFRLISNAIFCITIFIGHVTAQKLKENAIPPAPLFCDPIFDGAADPAIFWNDQDQNWGMIYTQRRANSDTYKLGWVHGTAIGMASSDDGGLNWKYRGTLDLNYEGGHNTFWAPEIYKTKEKYQVFVSYVQGVPYMDFNDKHKILLFEGEDIWNLSFVRVIDLQTDRVIDPSLIRLSDGSYRLWYKNENEGYTTHYADSKDLITWNPKGQAIDSTNCEGANVFKWQGQYWMITDPWKGIALYNSKDATNWKLAETILSGAGQRKDDGAKGHHACVVPSGEYAYIFYHCNPDENNGPTTSWETIGYRQRRSVIQVARLRLDKGKVICDRDAPFPLAMIKPEDGHDP